MDDRKCGSLTGEVSLRSALVVGFVPGWLVIEPCGQRRLAAASRWTDYIGVDGTDGWLAGWLLLSQYQSLICSSPITSRPGG
jgi:hypothetical protein